MGINPKHIIIRVIAVTFLNCILTVSAKGQELLCKVDINTDAIETPNTNIFETLSQSITDYMNETKWTNTQFGNNERIECRLLLTVREYSGNRIKGDLQVQSSRPVYNSNYNSTMFNFKDNKVEFDYYEGQPLVFNENIWTDNLTGILDFYAYFMLALDFDSFSEKGGQPYFDMAATIVQQAQSSGESGWKIFEDNRNRSALLNSYTDQKTKRIRDIIYEYHRKGLDEMSVSPDKGRTIITESIKGLQEIYTKAPMSVVFASFRDAKLDELENIYCKSPSSERETVYEILSTIYPSDSERLNKIKNPET